MKVKIDKAKLKRAVRSASVDPLGRAGALVEAEAKRSMEKGGRTAPGRDAKGKFTKGSSTPSTPGTPPHVQQGSLRASVAYAHDYPRRTVVVGPTEWYGKVHEYGGRYHPKRQFMRPALARVQNKFAKLFRDLRLRGR